LSVGQEDGAVGRESAFPLVEKGKAAGLPNADEGGIIPVVVTSSFPSGE
jgi:hypothetical protein